MKVKPEGAYFPEPHKYTPRHPAKWCVLRYLWTAVRTGNFYGPYGEMWSFEGHDWACYIRFRGLPSKDQWVGASLSTSESWAGEGKKNLRTWWRYLLWEHRHRDFRDIIGMADFVDGAEDPFIEARYEVRVHTIEGKIRPWSSHGRLINHGATQQ